MKTAKFFILCSFLVSAVLSACFTNRDTNDLVRDLTGIYYSEIPEEKRKFMKFDNCENLEKYYELLIERKKREKEETILVNSSRSGQSSDGGMMSFDAAPSSQEASNYTDTNVQVEGVDEADIVKTDGEFIYLVNEQKLITVLATPAHETRQLSEFALTGEPMEMFLKDNMIIIFENMYGLRRSDPFVGGITGPSILVEIVDVSDKENPLLLRAFEINGEYQSSRIVDEKLFFIVRNKDKLNPYMYGYAEEELTINKVLPAIQGNIDEEKIDRIKCDMVLKPKDYDPLNLITIFTLDLKEIQSDLINISALSDGGVVYASHDSIFLSDTERENSDIHKFDISGDAPLYVGSATIKGSVLDQFSMDEYDGYFRVASTQGTAVRIINENTQNLSESFLTIIDSELNIVSEIGGLGMGERIYSARFIGDKGFVVTFRKVDPLYTLDLSDPENPEIKGALKITGYSDYIHPLGENHLLTIGKEADTEGFFQGVALSIFDISDLENPLLTHREDIGVRGTESSALYNHKAFTFFESKGILAIPIYLLESEFQRDPMFDGLLVYRVDSDDGFTEIGRIEHSNFVDMDPPGINCHYRFTSNPIERSIMIDEAIYTLSSLGLKINDLNDFETLAQVSFETAQASIVCYSPPD